MPDIIMDVSRWQKRIDWDKVKASGLVSGVMLRALGNSAKDKPSKPYIDPTFERPTFRSNLSILTAAWARLALPLPCQIRRCNRHNRSVRSQ